MTKKSSYRFEGYTESWVEKKLGEVGETKSGVGFPDSEQGGVRGIPFYKVSDMNNIGNEIEMVTSNNYVTQEQIDSRKWKVIDTVPAIMFAKVGAALLLNRKRLTREPFLIDNNTMAYIPSAYWDTMFCKILFDTLNLSKYSQVGALPSYNGSDIEAIQVSLPSLPEQTAIGSFFQDIDQLISLQQRKLEVLKEQKKTYLKLLFPARGQTKPALRFAGFEDDWKEVKLGEVVASERKGKAKSEMIGNKSIYLDTIYLNGGEQTRVDCDCDTSKEDIIILWDGSQAGAVYYGFEGALGSTLKSYKIFGSGSFYYQQMKASQSLIFERYRTPNIPHVIKSFLDDFYIFTTSLPEQEAIGSFFKDLDKTVAKQEEKVNQLKESKQTLLRKMFI